LLLHIFSIRYANTTSEPTTYGEDLLSNRRDPSALKVIDLDHEPFFFFMCFSVCISLV
jgi:hypothetical protein